MNRMTALATRIGARSTTRTRGGFVRVVTLAVLTALLVPLLLSLGTMSASAKDDENPDNYSLYQLASNASTYFSEKNSPEGDQNMNDAWKKVTGSPATGGSLLGYADPEFSLGNIVGWFFAEVSGSSQTVTYDTLKKGNDDDKDAYSGMLDYAHFGAALNDLGLDSTSSGANPLGQIMASIGGSIMWIAYALALAVSMLFYVVIQLLKVINPFGWFYLAVSQTADSSGNTSSSHQQELADGMTAGQGAGYWLGSLQTWISGWYTMLQSIAWEALVPLFIGLTIIGLVLFKKMDRGSAIKKLIVRIVFIGVGLPLVGSMYTGVLDKFDDDLLGQNAGPTRVVLSTYVDFEAWAMNDRLAIPDDAKIGWSGDQASNTALMNVRTSALAINVQSHTNGSGDPIYDLGIKGSSTTAEDAWKNGTTCQGQVTNGDCDADFEDNATSVFTTFGIIGKYISGSTLPASDFESGIKSSITKLPDDDKKDWFVNKNSYGDVERFGDEDGPDPDQHPVISTLDTAGLTSSSAGGNNTTFTTADSTTTHCKFQVKVEGALAPCNLSALSMYNYLNTGFDSDSLTMYSSNNAASGFTRESHAAVSQVGTGPAKFMYWHNAVTVLACIVVLGMWYAIGMLAGAVKRTFSLVAAIPFATLGALAAISKVIVYTTALILEVLVTLFLYQFVSELLISIPDIIAGPISQWMSPDGLFGSPTLGGLIVVIVTLLSSLLIMGVTIALLRVRKVVLQAMDEVFTKLVDKFLETNTTPKPDKGGGLMPSLAAGAGAGAGMALGNKLASGVGGKLGGNPKSPTGGKPGGQQGSTNAGGLNPSQASLQAGTGTLALEGGQGGEGGPDGNPSGDGGGSGGPNGPGGRGGPNGAAGDGKGGEPGPGDKGGPLQLSSGKGGSSHSDKETAQALSARGGLSNLGFGSGKENGAGTQGGQHPSGGATNFGMGGSPSASGSGGSTGTPQSGSSQAQGGSGSNGSTGSSGQSSSSSSKRLSSSTAPTQFGTGQPGGSSSGRQFVVGPGGTAAMPAQRGGRGPSQPAARPQGSQGGQPRPVPQAPASTGRRPSAPALSQPARPAPNGGRQSTPRGTGGGTGQGSQRGIQATPAPRQGRTPSVPTPAAQAQRSQPAGRQPSAPTPPRSPRTPAAPAAPRTSDAPVTRRRTERPTHRADGPVSTRRPKSTED